MKTSYLRTQIKGFETMTDIQQPRHQRRSIRLKDYDYRQNGAYFVTICTHQRLCLFGEVRDSEMILNSYGEIVSQQWEQTGALRDYVVLDTFVVMPNHVHGIIWIVDNNDTNVDVNRRGLMHQTPPTTPQREFSKPIAKSLSSIVGAFKAAVTRHINRLPESPDHPIWQRNFYEHIIRNEPDLNRIRDYIQNNPVQWEADSLYETTN